MNSRVVLRLARGVIGASLVLACTGQEPPAETAAPGDSLGDSLTTAEQEAFAVDPLRYPEMRGGRLDTVDMLAELADAGWHLQAANYKPDYTALTYAAWYTGPDSAAILAADGQPYLRDELGNVYRGLVIPENPRFQVASGTTAVGVYVFQPGLAPGADSLILFINDSTTPVFRIGPFGVRHAADGGSLSPNEREAGDGVELLTGD